MNVRRRILATAAAVVVGGLGSALVVASPASAVVQCNTVTKIAHYAVGLCNATNGEVGQFRFKVVCYYSGVPYGTTVWSPWKNLGTIGQATCPSTAQRPSVPSQPYQLNYVT
jgi:hypothetical protein